MSRRDRLGGLTARSEVRFALASLAALGLDAVLTLALSYATPLSLTASAAIGFLTVGVAFYFVHEFWTFRRPASGVSVKRLLGNLGALTAAFVSRVGTIGLLETAMPPAWWMEPGYFAMGAAISFTVNYLVNRLFVFRAPRP